MPFVRGIMLRLILVPPAPKRGGSLGGGLCRLGQRAGRDCPCMSDMGSLCPSAVGMEIRTETKEWLTWGG